VNTIYYTILYFTSSNDDGTVYSREMRGIQEEVNQAKSSYCVPPAVLLLSLIHYSSSLRRTILHYKLRVEGSLTESNQKTFMRLRERKRKEKGKQASKQARVHLLPNVCACAVDSFRFLVARPCPNETRMGDLPTLTRTTTDAVTPH
jgi:hypothetical protein